MGVEGTSATSLRRALDVMRTGTHVIDEQLGTFAMRQLDERIPVFARDAPGELLQPLTPAASRMLEGSDGARARRILDAATQLADERPASGFRGIVLPDDPDALQGWWRLRELADDIAGGDPSFAHPELIASRLLHDLDATAASAAADFENTAHYARGFVVDLNGSKLRSLLTRAPDAFERSTRVLLKGFDDEFIAGIVAADDGTGLRRARTSELSALIHEVEHADGILDYKVGAPDRAELSRIFEEGGNQVVTFWPGRRSAFAERAGLLDELDAASLAASSPKSYEDEHAVMLDLVRRSGIDTNDPDALTGVVELLRGRRYYDMAIEDVARSIARNEGRDVNPSELQAAMRATPKTDELRARLDALAAQVGTPGGISSQPAGTSTMIASPWPPPEQMAATPMPPPMR
jgi:hypothetical protein